MSGSTPNAEVDNVDNVLGAVIFVAYILAALLFTALILRNLYLTHKSVSSGTSKRSQNQSELRFYAGLSLLSFLALSANMLLVLDQSYLNWSLNHQIPLPPNFASFIRGRDLHLWHWAKTSTLFQDFARDLCADAFNFWWTQSALLLSLLLSVYMAVEGPRRKIDNLLYYFILEQILPLSFTQNLFIIAVLLRPFNDKQAKKTFWTSFPVLVAPTSLVVFSYLLWTVHSSSPVSIPLIFLTRILLFLPYLLRPAGQKGFFHPTPCKAENLHGKYRNTYRALILGALVLHGLHTASMFASLQPWSAALSKIKSARSALSATPAVAALGYDVVLSLISGGFWFALVWQGSVA